MKRLQLLFSLLVLLFCCCNQPVDKNAAMPGAQKPEGISPHLERQTDTSISPRDAVRQDTVAGGTLEFCGIANKKDIIAIFETYGAELVRIKLPKPKKREINTLLDPDTAEAMVARASVKMTDPSDFEHAVWTYELLNDSVILMKTPIGGGTAQLMYKLDGDTLITESTTRNNHGFSIIMTTKQSCITSGPQQINKAVRTQLRDAIVALKR